MTCLQATLSHVPQLPSTTMVLDLDDNHISVLHNATFSDAPRLEIISLQHNDIMAVEGGTFSTVPQLRTLRLGSNRLAQLPRGIFYNNHQLQVLDLSQNLFAHIPDYLLEHLNVLQELNLSFNRILSPQLGPGFKFTTQLRSLDLSGNSFLSLEPHAFQATMWWDEQTSHHLNLSYCSIRHIHPKALEKLDRLEGLSLAGNPHISASDLQMALQDLEVSSFKSIDLSGTNLSIIPEFFRRIHLETIVELHLANNSIQTVGKRSFFYLINLELLDLSYNLLQDVGDMTGLNKLKTLNLAFNHIRHLDNTAFENLQNLQQLDLSHNALSEVTHMPFQTLFELATLDLSCNQIAQFSIESGLESLEKLSIRHNRLSKLGTITRLPQLHTLDASHNIITRLGANLFNRGHDLHLVNLSANSIYDVHSKAFSGSTQDILDLSHNKLLRVSNFGWRHITKLYLENNAVFNITTNAFKRLTTLQELHLQGNNLQKLPLGLFYDQHELRRLDLSSNPALLGYLHQDSAFHAFEYVSRLEVLKLQQLAMTSFPWRTFKNVSSLRSLDVSFNNIEVVSVDCFSSFPWLHSLNLSHNALQLSHPEVFGRNKLLGVLDMSYNPFHCTCDLMPFQHWLYTTNISVPHKADGLAYLCVQPQEWRGVPLQDFQLQSTMCSHQEKAVIFTALSSVLLALTFTLLVLVCRYKWTKGKVQNARYSVIDETSAVQVSYAQES